MRISLRRLCAGLLTLFLGACSSGGVAPLPVANQPASSGAVGADTFHATITVVVPRHRRHRVRGHFVSPATKGMTIAITGPTKVNESIGLTPSSPGCVAGASGTACTVKLALSACASKVNCYSGSVTTYDKVVCTKTCTIPSGAHALSANQDVSFSIGRGKKNKIGLTLDGIPSTAGIVPGTSSTLRGSSADGFTVSKCVTVPQNVTVAGFDADGNQIVGPGALASATLASDDTAHLAVASPAPSASPDAFKLVPPATLVAGPTIPKAGTVVDLTVSVTPLAGSGTSAVVHGAATVTFNSDVCGIVKEFPIPTASPTDPYSIVSGPDGNLWFTEACGTKMGKITTSGTITEYPTKNGLTPRDVAVGSDGNLWFTEINPPTNSLDKVGKMTTGGVATDYDTSASNFTGITGIASGADGNLWFSECYANYIDTFTTSGANFTQYNTHLTASSHPEEMTAGPDGNVWFVEDATNYVGKITTGGTITEYSSGVTGTNLGFITSGPDGNVWFTEGSGKIAKVTTNGVVTEYSKGITAASYPFGITGGRDGNVWFTESDAGKVAKITTGGVVTEYSNGITSGAYPAGIAWGPDGSLWFAECGINKIARMQ